MPWPLRCQAGGPALPRAPEPGSACYLTPRLLTVNVASTAKANTPAALMRGLATPKHEVFFSRAHGTHVKTPGSRMEGPGNQAQTPATAEG